jgi:hypothetical protein
MAIDRGRRHLFISHHHKDDEHVARLTDLLKARGYDIRNSSIRANPKNQERLDKGLVSDKVIRRLLRLKISWSTTVVVLIGKETHRRPWVDWEIEEANKQGKRIVGVYARGGTEADVPEGLKKYGTAQVGWNSNRMMAAIDGEENVFEESGGSTNPAMGDAARTQC